MLLRIFIIQKNYKIYFKSTINIINHPQFLLVGEVQKCTKKNFFLLRNLDKQFQITPED